MTMERQLAGWQPVSLPFFRVDNMERFQLPTADAVRRSGEPLLSRSAVKIVAMSPDIIVKYGVGVKEREGQTLLFIEQALDRIVAPKLFAMFYEGQELFIMMERIHGCRLDEAWSTMSGNDKIRTLKSLKSIFTDIRALPCATPHFLGSVDGGPVPHHLFFTMEKDASRSGPFFSEADFNRGLVKQYDYMLNMNSTQNSKASFYERCFNKVLQGHRVCFTHGDFQRKNVILRNFNETSAEHTHTQFTPILLDWEDAGWFPEYWEYFVVYTSFDWEDDWDERVESFLNPWHAETAALKLIYTDLFF